MIFQAGVVSRWTNDNQRFLLEHFDTIQNSPSHIYYSALPFSPSSSWIQQYYTGELFLTVKVVKGLSAEWGMCSRTVLLDSPTGTLSYHDNTIAVGCESGDIIILDTITGSQRAILSGHTDQVNSVTFSPDGTSLVSGSRDYTVKLWDVQTGGVSITFSGHNNAVISVSMSADNTMIASGSHGTICLWNIQTGKCHHTIRDLRFSHSVKFSPTDPQYLISASGSSAWQWDTDGHQIRKMHGGFPTAFSSDGTQLFLYNRETITVRNSNSGETVSEFQMGTSIYLCCFSPENRLMATTTLNTAYVWDIKNSSPHLVETFTGHTERITSIAFSSPSCLISASADKSIKFWQIGTPSTDPTTTDPHSTSLTSAPIRSITLQAKDGITITSDSDGVVKTWDISTGLCKSYLYTPADYADCRDIQLIDGRLTVVWSGSSKINLWTYEKGKHWSVDSKSENNACDIKISWDGSKVFCLYPTDIHFCSVETGKFMGKVKVCVDIYHIYHMSLVASGSEFWVHNPIFGYKGWKIGILGPSPIQTTPHKFHPSGAISWDISLAKVKDKATGKVVFQLPRGLGKPADAQWNGQYLVFCYSPKDVLILDFSHILL